MTDAVLRPAWGAASSARAPDDARASILVVEDDPAFAQVLVDLLRADGYRVWHAPTGAEAEAINAGARPDLILLDLILPDVDGLLLCTRLKEQRKVSIIVLSGTRRKHDGVFALKLGADDFVGKPCDLDELEARLEAVLRRSGPRRAVNSPSRPVAASSFGLALDDGLQQATIGGVVLPLTPSEYRVLATLASHPGRLVSREELARDVWGDEAMSGGRTLEIHIRRLRGKLQCSSATPPKILSVRARGYRITVADPTAVDSHPVRSS